MRLTELLTDAEFARIYPLVAQMNPTLTEAEFTRRLGEMRTQGYRCVAAMDGGEILGIAGFWQGTRFWCGRFIDFDNVVVDEKGRGSGVGKRLVAWVEEEAKRLGCEQTGLDCYTHSHGAHRFYFREGYVIKGYHFIKPLK